MENHKKISSKRILKNCESLEFLSCLENTLSHYLQNERNLMIKLLDQTALCQASEVHLRSSRCLLTLNGQNADPDLISDP